MNDYVILMTKPRFKYAFLILSGLFYFLVNDVNAQNHAVHWQFGYGAGIKFELPNYTPVAISSAISTSEGCASISNEDGDLMFYTDGSRVYDRNDNLMPNGSGLKGDNISAQSAIIIPDQSNVNKYYIFTIDDWKQTTHELNYSIVDMSLPPNGDVTNVKNVLLHDKVGEQVTATWHANYRDVWIVTHERNGDNFFAFKLKSNGTIDPPVISKIGSNHTGSNRYGYLRFSQAGDKLASSLGGTSAYSTLEMFDFNTSTGKVSNLVNLSNPGEYYNFYCSEFSPDGTKLYATEFNDRIIVQFDLMNNNQRTLIQTSSTAPAVQLGPDKKIYVVNGNRASLGVINEPNKAGLACDYVDQAILLQNRCGIGLPNFLPVITSAESYKAIQKCENDSINLEIELLGLGPWNISVTHDGNVNTYNNVTNSPFVYPNVLDDGFYFVEYKSINPSDPDILFKKTFKVFNWPLPEIQFVTDKLKCEGDSIGRIEVKLLNENTTLSYEWFNNQIILQDEIDSFIDSLNYGIYKVNVTDEYGCKQSLTDTLKDPEPFNILFADYLNEFCFQDSSGQIIVYAPDGDMFKLEGDVERIWQEEDVFLNLHFQAGLNYFDVIAKNANGCLADSSIEIDGLPPLKWTLIPENRTVCKGSSVELNAEIEGGNGSPFTYMWNNINGINTLIDTIYNKESYEIIAFDKNGCPSTRKMINIDIFDDLTLELEPPTINCFGTKDTLLVRVITGVPSFSFNWKNDLGHHIGSLPEVVVQTNQGKYFYVKVQDSCSQVVWDSIYVFVPHLDINLFVSDTIGCAPLTSGLFLEGDFDPDKIASVGWDFGNGEQSNILVTENTWNELGIYNIGVAVTDTFGCRYFEQNEVEVKQSPIADFIITKNPIDASAPNTEVINKSVFATDFQWTVDGEQFSSDFDSKISFPIDENGEYTICLKAENEFGCVDSTCKKIEVLRENRVYVPNSFTPNGDGINESFFPVFTYKDVEKYEFLIFDRWGELIFESTDLNQKWDGTYKGVLAKNGVYTWKLRFKYAETIDIFDLFGMVVIVK